MLLVADDDLGDPDLPCFLERAREQPVGLLRAFGRQEVVRLPEVDRVDLVQVDEIADVDRVGELDIKPVEVLVLQGDIAAFLDLEAPDDLVGVDPLPVVPAHLLVGDRRQVLLVEEVEAELLRLRRREHAHRDADETKRDRAAPDRAHAASIPERARVSTSDSGANVLLQTRALALRKASPPSGGVDSSGRSSGPKSFRSRG